jgi:hypothetical protein
MKTSESIKEIAVALHKFHGLMGKVGKDAVNPHFKNKYASLSNIIEATTPHLNAVGLSIIQLPCESGLETMLLHTSGEYISSVSLTPCKDASNPQALGSALTYAKRYSYAGALNLNIDEDDDAQRATVAPVAQTPRVTDHNATVVLNACTTIDELGAAWKTLNAHEQRIPSVIALKESLKAKFTQP